MIGITKKTKKTHQKVLNTKYFSKNLVKTNPRGGL